MHVAEDTITQIQSLDDLRGLEFILDEIEVNFMREYVGVDQEPSDYFTERAGETIN